MFSLGPAAPLETTLCGGTTSAIFDCTYRGFVDPTICLPCFLISVFDVGHLLASLRTRVRVAPLIRRYKIVFFILLIE